MDTRPFASSRFVKVETNSSIALARDPARAEAPAGDPIPGEPALRRPESHEHWAFRTEAQSRSAGEAPACFRDFMGYHGISRAVKEPGRFPAPSGAVASFSDG